MLPRIAGADYAERSAAFIAMLAQRRPAQPLHAKDSAPYFTARLQLGTDTVAAILGLELATGAALKEERADPFNLHALMHAYLLYRSLYPPGLVRQTRAYAAKWDYTRSIGVSLNYELMRDAGGYLAAQEWSDLTDAGGNSAKQVMALCGKRLMTNLSSTCLGNATEYDAPIYYGTDFAPLRMLAEFTQDPQLRTAARMTLDFMLVQTAAHWLQGYHISTSGRSKYWGSAHLGPDNSAPTNAMAYLLFGGHRPANLTGAPQAYWLAHPGVVLPTEWLPALQQSLPETRTVLASYLRPKVQVRKTTFFNGTYGLASQREDGTPADQYLFKECRRTLLKWISSAPQSTFTIFQENRRRPGELINNEFCYGENPYAQVMQNEGTPLGIHKVPAAYGFHKLYALFTTAGGIQLRMERDGWIACHGGSALFAFRSLEPGAWTTPKTKEQLDLYLCPQEKNAWVIETSRLEPYAGGGPAQELTRFLDALTKSPRFTGDLAADPPTAHYLNLADKTLDLQWSTPGTPYQGQAKVDGQPLPYNKLPLLQAPGIQQEPGGHLVVKTARGPALRYDFRTWAITNERASP